MYVFLARWTHSILAESFNQSIDDVRLILRQRTARRMRVRARAPSSLFGIEDEQERERLVRDQLLKRDLSSHHVNTSNDDEQPVDCRVLAEESRFQKRYHPSDDYRQRRVSDFNDKKKIVDVENVPEDVA
jgi:hypothetical protein